MSPYLQASPIVQAHSITMDARIKKNNSGKPTHGSQTARTPSSVTVRAPEVSSIDAENIN